MGMYDRFKIDSHLLPVSGKNVLSLSDKEFQTKDLDCELDLIFVGEEGFLYKELCSYVRDEGIGNILKLDYSGEVCFYNEDFIFTAFFDRGKLLSVIVGEVL